MAQKELAISGTNGLPILRAMGVPLLFDGRGSGFNLGVAGVWVPIFNFLTPISYGDRCFYGLSAFNASPTYPIYLAFEQVISQSPVKSIIVEPGADFALDNMTFGPGHKDKWANKFGNYVLAMTPTAVGAAAVGTATFTTNPTDGEQFTLGVNTYTFHATAVPTTDPFGILLGSTLAISLTNAKNALNADDPNVTATASSTVLTVTSNWTGTGMNSYPFVDVSTGANFTGTGTLGGSGGTAGSGGIILDANVW